jgi:molecular chaperone GrpE
MNPADQTPEEHPEEVAAQPDADLSEGERSAEELAAALGEAERAAEEYLDHLRRERAEFENFRRRTTKERMEALDRGAEQVLANLLGVLDNFGYTLQAARASADDQLGKGVEMVHGELMKVLTDAGLEEVPGTGSEFDPVVHEAMLQVDAAEELAEPVDHPVVVEVLRPGYRFKGRLLRPASVKVAR